MFKKVLSIALSVFVVLGTVGFIPKLADAAALTALSDSMSTLKVSTLANHDILFTTPTGLTSGQTFTITFPGSFSIAAGLTFADIDVLDDGVDVALAASPSGATWGVARTSSTVLTFTNGTTAVGAGSVMRIKIGTNATTGGAGVQQITNDSSNGTKIIAIAGGTFADSGSISVNLLTDDTVAVSATVPQSISFSISSNTIAFGSLDTAAARYANTSSGSASDTIAHTLAVATNGTTGYTITLKGATLTSGSNTINAIGGTPAVSSTGTEQFGIYATKSGGVNGTIATPYATASSFGYTATATSSVTFASGSTATAAETYSLHYLANINATTEAGTYTTNLTYVATANF